ncbi:MAG: hypothetical protein RL131_590, partial [Bacteroidota bacterium]
MVDRKITIKVFNFMRNMFEANLARRRLSDGIF